MMFRRLLLRHNKLQQSILDDEPGFKAGTHYLSIFSQVMHIENPQLDFYALAHAKTGDLDG